jgi:hypothetical protein
MTRRTYASATWTVICVIVLAVSLMQCDLPQNRDNDIVVSWAMLVLGLPGSLLVAFLSTLLPNGVFPSSHCWSIVIIWLVFFLGGYLQWFVLLPFVANKFKLWKDKVGPA